VCLSTSVLANYLQPKLEKAKTGSGHMVTDLAETLAFEIIKQKPQEKDLFLNFPQTDAFRACNIWEPGKEET
jgi:hypothetical protein